MNVGRIYYHELVLSHVSIWSSACCFPEYIGLFRSSGYLLELVLRALHVYLFSRSLLHMQVLRLYVDATLTFISSAFSRRASSVCVAYSKPDDTSEFRQSGCCFMRLSSSSLYCPLSFSIIHFNYLQPISISSTLAMPMTGLLGYITCENHLYDPRSRSEG